MLDIAFKFLAGEVNAYLRKRTGSKLGNAELTSLVNDKGEWVLKEGNIGLTLLSIEEERVMRAHLPERIYQNGSEVVLQPPLKLNLVVLFTSRYKDYDQSLHFLSHVLTFFQANPSFTADSHPGLDPRIEKLALEMLSYGPEQLNQTWAYLGSKYLPSAIYRLRMVMLQDMEPAGIGQPITTIETTLNEL